MVGAERTVPERVGCTDAVDDTRERARGLKGEGEVEEMGIVWVAREEVGGVEESGVEEREWWGGEIESYGVVLGWWVDEDFEVCEHALVVGEEGGMREV